MLDSVPSRHMRCRITAGLRESTTFAFLAPRRLATPRAHDLSQLHGDASLIRKKEMDLITPWKIHKSHVISQDKWHSLRADTCVNSNGIVISPYYVFENPEWVCIFPLIKNTGEVLIVREYHHGARAILDGLPSGVVDATDADVSVAAARELMEETGYRGSRMVPVGSVYANWSNHSNMVHCFLALDCELTGQQSLDENEEIEVLRRSINAVKEKGYLKQAFHVCCMHLALVALNDELPGIDVGG